MKITIVGRHPTIQPGFCGVMSLYEGKHLAAAGHEVELLIPFMSRTEMKRILRSRQCSSLDDLPMISGNFTLRPIFLNDSIALEPCDVLIWQSTSAQDWSRIYPAAQSASRVLTKNFPKFVPLHPAPLPKDAQDQFAAFDLVCCALKEDFHAILQHPEFFNGVRDRVAYVPRGADPVLLHASAKADHPFIAVDVPNTPDDCAIEQYFEPIRQLKRLYPETEVVSLGRPISLEGSRCIKFCPFDQLYSEFLNPAWIYCVIDYGQSPPHVRGSIHAVDKRWSRRAIYEVQTVEAQMAGCVVTGRRDNIIPELVHESTSATFDTYATEDAIYESLLMAVEEFPTRSALTRQRALHNFTWEASIRDWEFACANLVHNGYQRNRTVVPAAALPYPIAAATRQRGDVTRLRAALNVDEKALIFSYADISRRYVEFGTGGSTMIACRSRAGAIESVETDKVWIDTLGDSDEIRRNVEAGRLRFHLLDIGPTKEWGYPAVRDPNTWVRYAKLAWMRFPIDDVDFVLVDGRFRVACALEAALRVNDSCRIAVDDFNDRPHYAALSALLDVEFSASRLTVFRKGQKWSASAAYEVLDRHRLDPR